MPNRQLSGEELVEANRLLADVRDRLRGIAGADADLLFALRRKVAKELVYDERSKPMQRRALKAAKRRAQGGVCVRCQGALPERYCVLDRKRAVDGYTIANTDLVCEPCDRRLQEERGWS